MTLECCHVCGGNLKELHNDIYECENCGNTLDLSVFEEVEESEVSISNQEVDDVLNSDSLIELDIDSLPF